jgi:hypothetical protein
MKNFIAAFCLAGLICGNISTANAENQGSDVKKNWEIQLEYLRGNLSSERNIDNYNVHVLQKMHQHRALSFYRGFTFTRATGDTNPKGLGVHYDGQGVGIGAAALLRWEKNVSGKLYANWDFGGSLMFYNKAHPYDGRAYGFLWRTGPSFTWKYRGEDSFTVGTYVSHFSNGMKKHNPGYNTWGVCLGINHKF